MSATAEGPILRSPIPTGEEVSANIAELTNGVFERIQPQLARYIADLRRRSTGSDTVRLSVDNDRLWDEGEHGRVSLHVVNKEARRAVLDHALGNIGFRDTTTQSTESHGYFIKHCVDHSDPERAQRYKPFGSELLLHVMRDRHPRGTANDHRQGLSVPRADYSTYPPEDWGERHGVGIELITGYHDPAREQPAIWRLGYFVKTRFDMADKPRLKTTSSFSALIDTWDIDRCYPPFQPTMTKDSRAHQSDVEMFADLFAIAKDLRPAVTPLAQQLKHDAKMQELWSQLRGGSAEQQAQAPTA
jgi:hypothetical protein